MIAQLDWDYIRTRPTKAVGRLISYALFEGRPVTTRGRWINPLVFANLRSIERLGRNPAVDRPVFIVGTGRSGTTILGKILSLHPRFGFLNEPKALWHQVCPREDVIGSYTTGPARVRLDTTDADPDVVRRARVLFGSYLSLVGADRLLDKYPDLVFRIPFLQAIFPDARFLFLVRNGWDACFSVDQWSDRHGVRQGGAVHDWWGVSGRKWSLLVDQVVADDPELSPHQARIRSLDGHADRAAVEWILAMREGRAQMERARDDVRLIRYEDLCRDPAGSLGAILEFCSLREDRKMMSYARDKLTPRETRPRADLDETILPSFRKTLEDLGYTP